MIMPDLVSQGMCKKDLGALLATMAISYGVSNLVMGFLADKLNIRLLMPLGLVVSALLSLTLASLSIPSTSFFLLIFIMACNGWMQGIGWPCCSKLLGHWFPRTERGRATGFLNLSNNFGAGLLGPLALLAVGIWGTWQAKLFLPAIISLVLAVITVRWLIESPHQASLPALEEEDNHQPVPQPIKHSSPFREYYQNCLKIPALWLLALLNACVYFIRYGVMDWLPLYMTEVKHCDFNFASWAFFAFEFAAIPGTLICGLISDKLFHARRVPVNLLYMSLVLLAVIGYWHSSTPWTAIFMLTGIGFLIYGPAMLVHVHVIDLVPLKHVAGAAGFVGLFGYLIGATSANLVLGSIIDTWGWDKAFHLLTFVGGAALILLTILWHIDRTPRSPLPEPVDSGTSLSQA